MLKLWDLFDILANAKGKNEKIKVIENIIGDPYEDEFKLVVTAALKQGLSWHIGSVESLPNTNNTLSLFGVQVLTRFNLTGAINELYKLNDKGSANSNDKLHISDVRMSLDKHDRDLFDKVINRDLKCGANLSSFRKVFGKDFCPDFPKMLCSSYDLKKIEKNISFPAYSQLKSDGARAQCLNYNTTIYSRNGSVIQGLEHIAEECLDMFGKKYVVDGELVVVDFNGKILPREEGNGIINKCIKGTASAVEKLRVRFIIWDIIHIDEFYENREAVDTYSERWFLMNNQLKEKSSKYLIPTECKVVNSLAEAKLHYKELVAKGEEGTILKDMMGLWENKRSKTQYKFKEELEGDFVVVGWYAGKKGSKYETMIGGLECESRCGKIKFSVGSGLTDADRKLDGNGLINTCVEIIYNARTWVQSRGNFSLFLPRLVEIRFDKTKDEANTFEEIEANERASRELK